MGRLTGSCSLCGRSTSELHRCKICGAAVCPRCYSEEAGACKKCLSKGLWVEEEEEE
ncbi:MAG: orotate phosphoribosyltransferase [Hadesarchaea archaeon]|jgi:ribosomal protein L40E|nr:MAG: orotate phosphoribosyltransferase [Hadesarchaea archaeon]